MIDRIDLERVVYLKNSFADHGREFDYDEIGDLEEFIKNTSYHDIEEIADEMDFIDVIENEHS